uniref:Oxidoreductase n=1 Tax=Streptomyces albogriseolus TaxID=1887 RepID=V9XQV2_STRAO|nr:oxidoreductase [Streptomyces albogriseolus]
MWPGPARGEYLAGRGEGAGGYGFMAVLVVRVRDPSRVHDLGDYMAAFLVHAVGDGAPSADLTACVEARGVGVALPGCAGLDAFGDDQAGSGPLSVVGGGGLAGHAGGVGAAAGMGAMAIRLGSVHLPTVTGLNRSGIWGFSLGWLCLSAVAGRSGRVVMWRGGGWR